LPLIILTEDGPLGKAGTQVWVDDDPEPAEKPAPRKSQPKKHTDK
jgi:hypothetical protein